MINIKRERWIIVLDNKEVFCGLAKNYWFKPLDNMGNTSIKTYRSEETALSAFKKSWFHPENMIQTGRIRAVKVIESIQEI